jgi:hypothetical protein
MTTSILKTADDGCATLVISRQVGKGFTSKSSRLAHIIRASHPGTHTHFPANRNIILSNYELVLEEEVAETVEFEPLPDPLLPPLLPPPLPFFF